MTSAPLSTPGPDLQGAARERPNWRLAALVLVGLYLAVALPLILLLGPRGRPGEDQINYHEPAIRTFARQLPSPDLHDYLSATTPGYHLVLASIARAISDDERVLQTAGAAFTVLLLALLARTVARVAGQRASWREVLALCLPFACSMYVLEPGVWLLPDNAGWLMVLACLALALRQPFDRTTIVLGGVALAGLVLVRQVHLWAAGALWAAAWLAPGIAEPGGVRQLIDPKRRILPLGMMVAASQLAFLALGLFARTWHGLTPPKFQGQYAGVNFASFAFALSLLGIGSVFFVGYILDPLINLCKSRRSEVLLAALGGVLLAVVPPTTYDVLHGRYSGLWNLAARVPDIADHTSPVIVVLSALGAVMLLAWCRAMSARDRWIVLGAWFGFALAQALSYQLWERYNEPMVLMMLALMAACTRRAGATPPTTPRLIAPARLGAVVGLALLLAALSAYTISRLGPANLYDTNLVDPKNRPTTPPP